MILYFENSEGKVRRVGKINGHMSKRDIYDEVFRQINQFCYDRHFTVYYVRMWNTELRGKKATQFDVGSHTEFFYTVPELKIPV